MGLTPKQEMFVQGIVSGLSQREAYKSAYNAANMKDNTIDRKAYELFGKDYIRARYQELIEEFKEKALYTREEAVKDLIWIKEEARRDIQYKGVRQANGSIFVSAIKELGELNELYPSKKQDVTLNGAIEVNNPLEGLSTEELRVLATLGEANEK